MDETMPVDNARGRATDVSAGHADCQHRHPVVHLVGGWRMSGEVAVDMVDGGCGGSWYL